MLAKHARVLGMCDIELVRVSVSHSDNWQGCKGGIERRTKTANFKLDFKFVRVMLDPWVT